MYNLYLAHREMQGPSVGEGGHGGGADGMAQQDELL